jgi:nitroreductase
VIESASVLSEAPAAVFIENRGVFTGGRDGLVDAPRDRLKGSLTGYGLELVGIGAALQNMWIAALSLGLSAAFLGDIGIAERRIKDDLAIQGDVVGALVLGYSRDLPTPALPPPPETQTTMPVVRHD